MSYQTGKVGPRYDYNNQNIVPDSIINLQKFDISKHKAKANVKKVSLAIELMHLFV